MPIEHLNLELRELGKLKLGTDTGDRPRALDTWRLTSRHADLIEAAADLYGGTPAYDHNATTAEVITETPELEVLLPPQDVAANQWFEHWQAGGLKRRCTGTAMVDYDGQEWRKVAPCQCSEENRTERLCKPTTVLRVVLPELPDVGIWRLTTKSIFAAQELPGVAALLISSTSGPLAPAILGIDSRTIKRPGEPPNHFKVPVLRSRGPLTALLAGGEAAASSSPAALGGSPTAIAPTAGLDGAEIRPAEAPSAPNLEPNEDSGPPTPDTPLPPIWVELAGLITEHTPDTITGEGLARTIHTITELERLMQAAHLWPENALAGMARKWLGESKVNWRDLTGPDIKAFGQRVLIQATREVEDTGLGSRALQRHRQEETNADKPTGAHT